MNFCNRRLLFCVKKYTNSLVSLVCEALDFIKCFFYILNPINKYNMLVIKPAKTAYGNCVFT